MYLCIIYYFKIRLWVWCHIQNEFFLPRMKSLPISSYHLDTVSLNCEFKPFPLQVLCSGTAFYTLLYPHVSTHHPNSLRSHHWTSCTPDCCQMLVTSTELHYSYTYSPKNITGHISVASSPPPSLFNPLFLLLVVHQEHPAEPVPTTPGPSSTSKDHRCSWRINKHIIHQFSKLTRTHYSAFACSS